MLAAHASSANAEDLLEVYNMAVAADAEFRAATAARDAALELIPQSRAYLLPKLDITGDVTRDRFDPREVTFTNSDTSYATNETYSLELRQAVYQRARFKQLEQADHDVAQAVATYTSVQQDLAVRVAEQYFQLLAAQDNLEFVTSNKAAIAVSLEQANHRYSVGLAAPTDLYEAQARHDIAVSEELSAQKLLEDAREALYGLTGKNIGQTEALLDDIPLLQPDPADPDRWVETAKLQSPILLAATETTKAARETIEMQRSGHYPSVDLIARYQYRDNNFGGVGIPIQRNDSAVGLQFTVPLYQGGLVSSRSRQAAQQYNQAHEIQIGTYRETELQTRQSYRGVVVELSKINALQQAIVSNEKALDASQTGYEVGTRNITDVLDAQRELLRARRDHARSRYDYLLNTLRLKRAVGSLDVTDIEAMNAYLQ
jgi:outer membrane protein